MHYVVSDIHGEFDRYRTLLERIDFSDDDTLYVLGDAIDRGSGGIDVIKDIMVRDNVVMLMGNHELMCLAAMAPQANPKALELWVRYNGGGKTRRALLYKTGHTERVAILHWMPNFKPHQIRSCIRPGQVVDILLKKDQPTGILTRGEVGRILTNSLTHPRGIKVMLSDGRVGRVQVIVETAQN